MYAVWRHTLGDAALTQTFHHRAALRDKVELELDGAHATYEAQLVRYADDITWMIENLNDANRAVALGPTRVEGVYAGLRKWLHQETAPERLLAAIADEDAGQLYTYFISDLVSSSADRLKDAPADASIAGEGRPLIGLSEDADRMLKLCKRFLDETVFADLRVKNRNRTLVALATTTLEILYDAQASTLDRFLSKRSLEDSWAANQLQEARELLEDRVHRAQLAVDILASMSDKDVYDFVGLESS
jgi:dGTP triphosphohydrolase